MVSGPVGTASAKSYRGFDSPGSPLEGTFFEGRGFLGGTYCFCGGAPCGTGKTRAGALLAGPVMPPGGTLVRGSGALKGGLPGPGGPCGGALAGPWGGRTTGTRASGCAQAAALLTSTLVGRVGGLPRAPTLPIPAPTETLNRR